MLIAKSARAALNMARFVREAAMRETIMSGYSARMIALPVFIASWQHLFPGSPRPKIHWFNQEGNRLLYGDIGDQQGQRTRMVREFVRTHLPALNKVATGPLCFLDDFSATGEKYLALNSMFMTLGFPQVAFAYLAGFDRECFGGRVFLAEEEPDLVSFLADLAKRTPAGTVTATVAEIKRAIRAQQRT